MKKEEVDKRIIEIRDELREIVNDSKDNRAVLFGFLSTEDEKDGNFNIFATILGDNNFMKDIVFCLMEQDEKNALVFLHVVRDYVYEKKIKTN